jgi:peptide subunit release factor 1 (eRF1)
MAGWYGLEERKIERRIEDFVHRHFKDVSEGIFQYYQANNPDYFIIGGRRRVFSEFESHLHSNIQERIIARIRIDLEASISEILTSLEAAVQEFESTQQKQMISKLFEEQGPDGLAVTGLKATLRALWNGQVRTLFITEDYSRSGYYCPECWYMSNNEKRCANDHSPMKKSHDIIEDAIETAIFQNCEIIRVKDKKQLSGEHEHIGALLRFKI